MRALTARCGAAQLVGSRQHGANHLMATPEHLMHMPWACGIPCLSPSYLLAVPIYPIQLISFQRCDRYIGLPVLRREKARPVTNSTSLLDPHDHTASFGVVANTNVSFLPFFMGGGPCLLSSTHMRSLSWTHFCSGCRTVRQPNEGTAPSNWLADNDIQ